MHNKMDGSGRGLGTKAAIAAGALIFFAVMLTWLGDGDARAAVARLLDASAAWVHSNPLLAAATFVASTAAARLAPVPAGAMMTVTGGYLFGTLVGAVLAATGAATAAALAYALGRPLLAGIVKRRLGPRFSAIEREVASGGFNYLLALRILPVIPGWLVNLLPLAFPISIRTIVLATFLGLLPISLIFASFGAGLAVMGADPAPITATALMRWQLIAPLAGLAVLAVLPVVFRRLSFAGTGKSLRLPDAGGS